MRRIERAELDASVRLVRDGEDATDELEEKWRADPDNFSPKINNDIYGSVKDTLFQMQYAKCCYCETVIDAGFPGDVEHFRPKKEVTEDKTHPGYWWLAYEWSNLLLSCNRCNRAFKKNHFPLSPSSTRARERAHDLDEEEPLLIDPVRDEPGEHIGYREHMLVGKTEKGKRTIELLGLNREPGRIEDVETGQKLTDGLRGARERHYNKLKDLYTRLDKLLKALDGLRAQLDDLPDEVRSHLMAVEETARSEWNALLVYIQDPQEPYLAMSVEALDVNFTLSFDF